MKQGAKNTNNLIFIEASWFNTVGFVLAQDFITREYKCYTHKLGGDQNASYSVDQDIEKIMAHGSRFPLKAAEVLFAFDTSTDWVYDHPEEFL